MPRNSILNERHNQLGSKLDGDTRSDMPIRWSHSTDALAKSRNVIIQAGREL